MADGEPIDTRTSTDLEEVPPAPRPEERRARVLVVEDADDLRELYVTWLRARSFEVFEAADGRVAWECITTWHPDAVLLDLGLPMVDGWKLATLMRLDRRRRSPAVVVITGRVEPDAIQEALDAGVDQVLFKPCDANQIVQALERELARGRGT